MTTTPTGHGAATAAPRPALAAAFLQGLADQDFARSAARSPLTPGSAPCCRGACGNGPAAEAIAGQFARWFGDTEDFELVEATLGDVGGRLQLRWRLRLRAERLGAGWFTVEQQAYADAGEDGRIARLDLVCTGYRPEADNG